MTSLPSDHRLQREAPAPAAVVSPQDRGPVDFRLPGPRIWPTRGQWAFLAVVLGLLGVAFVGECVLNYDDASLLWRHPLGVRMVLPAVATVTFGIAVFLGSSLLINLLLPAANENRRLARRIVSGLLALAVFVLFFLPAFYVVLVGPSAIQILETIR